MLGGLDAGYDAVLFYGLTLKEMIDIADDMAMLPFEQARAFVDESMLKEVPPPRAAVGGQWEWWSDRSDGCPNSDGPATKGRRKW